MDNQRLGKGLSFLMGEDFLGQNSQNNPENTKEKIQFIAIDNLKAGRFQPRRVFNEDALEDLVKSYPKSPLVQVVGHTQVDRIILDRSANIIPVDVGLHRKLQYLVITDDGVPHIVDVPEEKEKSSAE